MTASRRRAAVPAPLRPTWRGPLGLYQPGRSWLHRASAGAELVGLAVASLVVVAVRGGTPGLVVALVALVGAAACHVAARLSWHRTRRGLLPTAVVAVLLGAYQTWARGWPTGVETATDLVALVLLANVVTATSRADDLLDAFQRAARPLRHVGLAPETVALACSLMLRSVPVLLDAAGQSRDAADRKSVV